MHYRIDAFPWQQAPQAVRDIRHQVFVEEQQVPVALEIDETDAIAEHFLLYLCEKTAETPVATARLYPDIQSAAHIGRMAILPQARGKGLGMALLRHLMQQALNQGFHQLGLSAQVQAVGFYQAAGFHLTSDVYLEAGIQHQDMQCLAPDLALSKQGLTQKQPLILRQDDSVWHFNSIRPWHDLLHTMAVQTSQRLWLYDQTLEHTLYNTALLSDALSSLARRHRLSEVRLLIHHDKPLVERRHAIADLVRRLPSKISLRLVNPDYPHEHAAFLLADQCGVMHRQHMDELEGFARFAAEGLARQFGEKFQRMWESSKPSAELRDLSML